MIQVVGDQFKLDEMLVTLVKGMGPFLYFGTENPSVIQLGKNQQRLLWADTKKQLWVTF